MVSYIKLTRNLFFHIFPGVCTNATAPSVSSINRILRNRAAERAAAEFARAAGYGLYTPHPYGGFPWPSPAHLWPPGSGLPGLTASSQSLGSSQQMAGSPGGSSSLDHSAGSPDGKLIGNTDPVQVYKKTFDSHDRFFPSRYRYRGWGWRQYGRRTTKVSTKSNHLQPRAARGAGERVRQITLSMCEHPRTISVPYIIEWGPCPGNYWRKEIPVQKLVSLRT